MKIKHSLFLTILLIIMILVFGCAPQQQLPAEKIGQQQQIEQLQPPQASDKLMPPECEGKKTADKNLPESCKIWFSIPGEQRAQPLQQAMPQQPRQEMQNPQHQILEPLQVISVKILDSKYKIASAKPTGWFSTGQDADIMLSGFGFNNAGGPLQFKHPGAVATDGIHLLLADQDNNRVLIWNKLPTANMPPDLVLGQKDFISNNPGKGLDQMNWPASVSTANGRVVVADTNNNRILIWNSFPTINSQPADLVIDTATERPSEGNIDKKRIILWPWGVWTDGKKLVVSSTQNGIVLIWNNLPAQNDQPADIYLTASSRFGTPRTITSDGDHLIVWDHNAKLPPKALGPGQTSDVSVGSFFWKTWPVQDDAPYDFFMQDPVSPNYPGGMQGDFTPDGKLVLLGVRLYSWDSFPQNENSKPALIVGEERRPAAPRTKDKYYFTPGIKPSIAIAGQRMYVGLSGGNKIVAYNSIPTNENQKPDFAIGSPDININTLETNFILGNPRPATDGEHLFVASDVDQRLYVYKNIPDESNAHPDAVYDFSEGNFQPWGGITVYNNQLALAGWKDVYAWRSLPLNGELPDLHFKNKIGNAEFQDIRGVTIDDKYFYLADGPANKIYVWEGMPSEDLNPKFAISTEQPWRLSSNGKYLVVASTLLSQIKIYKIADFSSNSQPIATLKGAGKFNLPESALISQGHLFVADTVFSRVLIWKNIEDAIAGKDADVILGAESLTETKPEIGKNKLFWPAYLAFDGSNLWAGEFKFSDRLIRYSVH